MTVAACNLFSDALPLAVGWGRRIYTHVHVHVNGPTIPQRDKYLCVYWHIYLYTDPSTSTKIINDRKLLMCWRFFRTLRGSSSKATDLCCAAGDLHRCNLAAPEVGKWSVNGLIHWSLMEIQATLTSLFSWGLKVFSWRYLRCTVTIVFFHLRNPSVLGPNQCGMCGL